MMLYFFFFQAEDGIRDYKVTGVQTCALPILIERRGFAPARICAFTFTNKAAEEIGSRLVELGAAASAAKRGTIHRSEERRVGKECRSGWSPDHKRKKRERKDRHREEKNDSVE